MASQTVPNRSGACQRCGKAFDPYPRRRSAQRFCSEFCRVSDWRAAQRPLDFGVNRGSMSAVEPRPDTSLTPSSHATGRPESPARASRAALPLSAPAIGTPTHYEQSRVLDKRESKKARLLALLQRGPARTWDCMLAGGSGWRSRLQELREEGHRISTEEHPDFAIYTLHSEAKP